MGSSPDQQAPATQRRGINYTGIAALLTAVGGVLGLFWQQQGNNAKQTMASQSIYKIMEYRLSLVEQVCGVPTPSSAGRYIPAPAHAPTRPQPLMAPVRVPPSPVPLIDPGAAPAVAYDKSPGDKPPNRMLRPLMQHKTQAIPASFNALQQLIEETGKPWEPEGTDGGSDHP